MIAGTYTGKKLVKLNWKKTIKIHLGCKALKYHINLRHRKYTKLSCKTVIITQMTMWWTNSNLLKIALNFSPVLGSPPTVNGHLLLLNFLNILRDFFLKPSTSSWCFTSWDRWYFSSFTTFISNLDKHVELVCNSKNNFSYFKKKK